MFLQKTIRSRSQVHGIGLHSGEPCSLEFVPAPPNTGVFFVRNDLPNKPFIKANVNNVKATGYATTLGGAEFSVSTVEHCLSALSALRIDNLIVELHGPEIPIVDGSALGFLEAINKVGLIEQDQPRRYCYITHPIYYSEGDKQAYVVPYHGLRLTVTIDFNHPLIGVQKLDLDINQESFSRVIAPARTFGFFEEAEELQKKGLAKGGSLKNAIILTKDGKLNQEPLRFDDEFVRHKALDALGDLVTLSMPLMGHLTLYKAGHDIMNKLVNKILNSPECFKSVELGAGLSSEQILRTQPWNH